MINFCGLNKHDTLDTFAIGDTRCVAWAGNWNIIHQSRCHFSSVETLSFLLHYTLMMDDRTQCDLAQERASRLSLCVTYRKMICLRSFSLEPPEREKKKTLKFFLCVHFQFKLTRRKHKTFWSQSLIKLIRFWQIIFNRIWSFNAWGGLTSLSLLLLFIL